MFLKSLKIEVNGEITRNIRFFKGINLIVDETMTSDRRESGNSVGKTTVLRLVDFCLGGEGKNIYQDTEFRNQNNTIVKDFLKNNNVVISLRLKEDLERDNSREVHIRRNFLQYGQKIQEINGEDYNYPEFLQKLKELIFDSSGSKPTFRQIIAKNIRDEKNKLVNTIKVLHPVATPEQYETLFLFWLGIEVDSAARKQKLLQNKKLEENLQKRLRKENNLPQITQSLLVINRTIAQLEERIKSYNLNESYNEDLAALNQTKAEINGLSATLSRFELRKQLILESKTDLEKDLAAVETDQVRRLYEQAKAFLPTLQKSFEETLAFHNQMILEKVKYITQELPTLEEELSSNKRVLEGLLIKEKNLTEKLKKVGVIQEFRLTTNELNKAYEKKGNLEQQKKLWEDSNTTLESINSELEKINEGIASKEELIQARIAEFNRYFSEISNRLYGEQFVLSAEKTERGYELNISSISGNLGTGKKKGEMAAFDLAYIQFADALGIKCLHFILQDQIENVHDNQITSLLTEIVSQINCQYVLPVLRDKLPSDIDVRKYQILSLSQIDKLFRI